MASYLNTNVGGSDTRVLDAFMPLAIERMLRVMRPKQDPFVGRFVSAAGVEKVGGPHQISRDWKFRRAVRGALTGVTEMDTTGVVDGPAVDQLDTFFRHNKANIGKYPDGSLAPRDEGYNIEISLKGGRSSLAVAIADHDVRALGALVGSDLDDLVEGWARQIAQYQSSHFYAQDSTGKVASFIHDDTRDSWSGTTDIGVITATLSSGDNINQFYRGQMVDLYEGATFLNEDTSNARI